MSTIADELKRILNAKADIKTAIENKGVTVGSTKLNGYAELIDNISGGSDEPLPEILDTDPLTFVRVDKFTENGYISLEKFGAQVTKAFLYNKNDEGWETYTEGTKIPMNYGDKVLFKSPSTTGMSNSTSGFRRFNTNGLYNCGGNINSLLMSADVAPGYCFYKLFLYCNIITAPKLTPTSLGSYAYAYMFYGCSLLVNAPELSATELGTYCCQSMFYGCTNLTHAPKVLPATELKDSCYLSMFYDCLSLVTAPELPATTIPLYGYQNMFTNCIKLNTIYCKATNVGASNRTNNWVQNVPNTTDCIFHKNPEWSGPTSRGVNTIPSKWLIVNWVQ